MFPSLYYVPYCCKNRKVLNVTDRNKELTAIFWNKIHHNDICMWVF